MFSRLVASTLHKAIIDSKTQLQLFSSNLRLRGLTPIQFSSVVAVVAVVAVDDVAAVVVVVAVAVDVVARRRRECLECFLFVKRRS